MSQPTSKLPKPVAVKAPHGADWFEIEWQSGEKHRLSNRILRGYCPCASCQGHSGAIKFVDGKSLALYEIHPVGNYAFKLVWGDTHSSGLYSFQHLYKLGQLYAEHGENLPTVHFELP
jgi:DUF971 family protein